jgi:hypothetical protein
MRMSLLDGTFEQRVHGLMGGAVAGRGWLAGE